jgi:hypothetical protein
MSTSRVPWKRVIAEFLAIFAGVTLSLFAEDWRQGREDRQREAEFLAEISQDLARDSTELGSLLAQMESWDAASLWVNRNARQSSMPRDSVFRYLRRFGIISFYQPVRSGYVSIRDAGLLHLLNDGDVRRGIVDYYEVRQPYIEQFFALVFDGWNRWYRISAPHIDWVAPEDRESMWITVRNGVVTSTWAEILADDSMRGHMDWAGLIGGNTAGRIRQVLDGNAALRKSISAYMDPPEPLAGSRDTGEES